MPTYEATRKGYAAMWARCEIQPGRLEHAKQLAHGIIKDRSRYEVIEAQTGVPWYLIAVLHERESSRNFNTYLGNGQSFRRVTTIEPKNRGPFASFEAGAVDALHVDGLSSIKSWPISRLLFSCEKFNGFGYTAHNENSPYVWSWTNLQQRGKYASDGNYDPNLMDPQPGCAALLKALQLVDPSIKYQQETDMATPTTTATKLPFTQILNALTGLEKFAEAAQNPLAQSLLQHFLPAQFQGLVGSTGEISERIPILRLLATLEQAAEANSGDAAKQAMAKVARDWADSLALPSTATPPSTDPGNIPGIRS